MRYFSRRVLPALLFLLLAGILAILIYYYEQLGKHFLYIAQYIEEKTMKTDNPAILLGIKREEELFLNPVRGVPVSDVIGELKPDDILVLMAHNQPNNL